MIQQEHGSHAFLALLRDAASGTEIPLQAWGRKLGAAALKPVEAACVSAMAACGARPRVHEIA